MAVGSFDRLALAVGSAATRRGVLSGLAATIGAVALGDAARAAKKKGKKGKGKAKPKMRALRIGGDGNVTQAAVPGCQSANSPSNGVCTTELAGDGASPRFGDFGFDSTLTADWSAQEDNGEGGFCAVLQNGSVGKLTSVSRAKGERGAIRLAISGKVCQVGNSSSTTIALREASYTIVGGTGRYKGATGTGSVEATVDGAGVTTFSIDGKIRI